MKECEPTIKFPYPVVDSIHHDHGEEAFLQGLVEALEHALPVGRFHGLVILVFLYLLLHSTTEGKER